MQSGCESQAGILLRILPESWHMHDRGHGPLLQEWRHFQICAAFHFAGMARSYGNGDIFRYARRFISQVWPAPTGMAIFSDMRGVLFRGHGPLLREWRHFQICAAFHFAGMARSYEYLSDRTCICWF
jgi:hypothetical protein